MRRLVSILACLIAAPASALGYEQQIDESSFFGEVGHRFRELRVHQPKNDEGFADFWESFIEPILEGFDEFSMSIPTSAPMTRRPSRKPSSSPTTRPTRSPVMTMAPTRRTRAPVSRRPTESPTISPSMLPSRRPSRTPISVQPARAPPTSIPTRAPTTVTPTRQPKMTPSPTGVVQPPTIRPSQAPVAFEPTETPVGPPAIGTPSNPPSRFPSPSPSVATGRPTRAPIPMTPRPSTSITIRPTSSPTRQPTAIPLTQPPSRSPMSLPPTRFPTVPPTRQPTPIPTRLSTPSPTATPSLSPTRRPTTPPSRRPTSLPTRPPIDPTTRPTPSPTRPPTPSPTQRPTTLSPTEQPTRAPIAPPPSASPVATATCDLDLITRCEECDNLAPINPNCQGVPTQIVMRFVGGSCEDTNTQQDITCFDFGDIPSGPNARAFIVVEFRQTVYFSGFVNVGTDYVIRSPNGAPLGGTQSIVVYRNDNLSPNNVLQSLVYVGNCTEPLRLDSQFGASRVVGFTVAGQETSAFVNLTVTHEVRNNDMSESRVQLVSLETESNLGVFNLTERVAGVDLQIGQATRFNFEITVDATVPQDNNFVSVVTARTASGISTCAAVSLYTFRTPAPTGSARSANVSRGRTKRLNGGNADELL